MTISEYIESLATLYLGHSDNNCHFSDASVFSTRVSRIMKYPCVGMDTQGWTLTGNAGSECISMQMNLYFLSHVRDTSSLNVLENCFRDNFKNAILFLGKIAEDKKNLVDPAIRFDISTSEGTLIEFKDAALYGYAVGMVVNLPFEMILCQMKQDVSLSL